MFFCTKKRGLERKYQEKLKGLEKIIPNNINIAYELAMPDIFEIQIKNSNAIIIYGGDDHLVQYWLKQFDIPKIWKDKTISVSSASSDALSTHFWTCDWRQAMDGLGILPIKMLPHFKSKYGADDPRGPVDWGDAYKELKSYGDENLPIHALEEGEFVVIKQ